MKDKFSIHSETSQNYLIERFNSKDSDAFTFIYDLFYDSIHMFSSSVYSGSTMDVSDIVQDIFISIWNSNTHFNSLSHIKGYLYLSVRNYYRKYIEHQKIIDKYVDDYKNNSDYFISEMVEVELVSKLMLIIDTLPKESARVLKLYIQGLDVNEIAEKLNKSHSTVYNQKNEAINILKRKFGKKIIFILSICRL